MPIFDVNIIRNIQIRKLEYIKSKLEIEDKRRELIHMFETIIHTIDILKQREAIANEDVRLYSSLLSSTKESLLDGLAVPQHKGAIKAFKEAGLLK